MQGSAAEATAKVEAARNANLDRAAAEKALHQVEIRLLGKAIAEELAPALTAAIRDAFAQMKEPK